MAKEDIRTIDKYMKENISQDITDIKWYDLNNEYILGSAFHNNFERLDVSTFVSENVETLKKHPAGLNIIFKTNSRNIKIKATLAGASYMSHMTSVGTIGFSLYVLKRNKWIFLSATKINNKDYTIDLLKDIDLKTNTYRLYFPLYQVLNSAYLGVDEKSVFSFVKVNMPKLVIYGTSISQGGCATRAGMDYGSILGRFLNLDVINLGFSGSCKIEKEMAEIINKIDKKYLILELEANSIDPKFLKERLEIFLECLKNKSNFKIYLISHFTEGLIEINKKYQTFRKEFIDTQKSIKGVKFIDGKTLLKKSSTDATVDGTHLTDLGFFEVASSLAKIIKDEEKHEI